MAAIARGEQRRALIIAAVGFVLVVGLFAGSRLMGGGGGEDAAAPTLPSTSAPATPPGTPPTAGGAGEPSVPVVPVVPVPLIPESFEALELRDPFTPPLATIELLRLLQPAPGEPGEPAQPGQPPATPVPSNVRLLGIEVADGVEVANLEVDGTFFDASEGQRFGPSDEFMAVTLDAVTQCGTFLFGDSSFNLCVGDNQPTPGDGPGQIPQK